MIFHAFYSADAENTLGSHHRTNDGRKYTVTFDSLDDAEMYLWKDKQYVGTITEYGKLVITNHIRWYALNRYDKF